MKALAHNLIHFRVVLKETTPIRIEIFHYRIKVVRITLFWFAVTFPCCPFHNIATFFFPLLLVSSSPTSRRDDFFSAFLAWSCLFIAFRTISGMDRVLCLQECSERSCKTSQFPFLCCGVFVCAVPDQVPWWPCQERVGHGQTQSHQMGCLWGVYCVGFF